MSVQKNPVGWFEIYVADMSRARKFYETVLDVQLEELPAPSMIGLHNPAAGSEG